MSVSHAQRQLQRTIQKYQKEAIEKNRDSWYLAFIMDTNEEERAKGKTVEVGRAHFQTKKKRYTLLDAPGHKVGYSMPCRAIYMQSFLIDSPELCAQHDRGSRPSGRWNSHYFGS